MERLTKRNADGSVESAIDCQNGCQYITCSLEEGIQCKHECEADIYLKLAEYEDLEEQGLLLKLPCKVGDTVYIIDKRYTKCSSFDEEYSESSCWNCGEECDSKMYYVVAKRYVGTLEWIILRLKYFNKTVFLTKEEAEKELEKRSVQNEINR